MRLLNKISVRVDQRVKRGPHNRVHQAFWAVT
jgi:hypothetical protein